MREELTKLIPEFNEIKDMDLREKTIKAWELAMEKGGWQPSDLEKIPFTLLIENVTVSFLEHTRAVTKVALGMAHNLKQVLGEKIPVNRDFLASGAILHDVGKLLEYKYENGKYSKSHSGKLLRHPFSGVQIATLAGLPDEISLIIAVHSHEGSKVQRTTEGILLHHADFTTFEPLHK